MTEAILMLFIVILKIIHTWL